MNNTCLGFRAWGIGSCLSYSLSFMQINIQIIPKGAMVWFGDGASVPVEGFKVFRGFGGI